MILLTIYKGETFVGTLEVHSEEIAEELSEALMKTGLYRCYYCILA